LGVVFCPLFAFKKFVLVTVKNTVRVRVGSRVRVTARVRVRVRLGLGSGLQLGFRLQGSSSELVT